MPTVNIKDINELKLVKLVDLSEDSINEIAEAVVQKLMSHGRWIREPNCWYRCSECGSHYPSLADNMDYHYCPNCGAKMDEVKE